MKHLLIILLFLSHSLAWANNQDAHQLGRSLANYQACSEISIGIDDKQMFSYYQKMLNDTRILILTLNLQSAKQLYLTWDKSEKILLKIDEQNLKQICLSRFDALSRQMASN